MTGDIHTPPATATLLLLWYQDLETSPQGPAIRTRQPNPRNRPAFILIYDRILGPREPPSPLGPGHQACIGPSHIGGK